METATHTQVGFLFVPLEVKPSSNLAGSPKGKLLRIIIAGSQTTKQSQSIGENSKHCLINNLLDLVCFHPASDSSEKDASFTPVSLRRADSQECKKMF